MANKNKAQGAASGKRGKSRSNRPARATSRSAAASKKMSFKAAVEATPSIAEAYAPGIRALLKLDKNRLSNAELATGSVALDDHLKKIFPTDHRWDYGIGLTTMNGENVLWLEVHHAASGETDRVLSKLRWLKDWLSNHAPELNKLPKKFIWLLSNVENNQNDRRKRQQMAEKHGLRRHQGILNLAGL